MTVEYSDGLAGLAWLKRWRGACNKRHCANPGARRHPGPAETRVMLLARRRNKRREDDSRRDDGLATSDVVLQQMRENVRQMFRSSKGCHVEMKYADPALPRAKDQGCGSCPTSLLHAEQVDEGARVLNRPGQPKHANSVNCKRVLDG